uniref:Uncharacterized protein n=1 Tax=Timema tahoe TaxID=61484 RepID=A0A7R9FIT9_9NEOP|nr:unnamed protein product [Timema tahoe]
MPYAVVNGENMEGRYYKSNDVIFGKLVRWSLLDACAQRRKSDSSGATDACSECIRLKALATTTASNDKVESLEG